MMFNPSFPPQSGYPVYNQSIEPKSTPEWYNYFFMAINGYIMAFNPYEQYKQVWKTSLKGTGWNQTRFATTNANVRSLALDLMSGSLFVTCGKLAHCLEAATGNICWKTKIKPTYCYLQIIPEGLLIGGKGYVQLIDTRTGHLIYSTSVTKGGDVTSIAVSNNVIYVGCSGKIYAVDTRSGQVLVGSFKNLLL